MEIKNVAVKTIFSSVSLIFLIKMMAVNKRIIIRPIAVLALFSIESGEFIFVTEKKCQKFAHPRVS